MVAVVAAVGVVLALLQFKHERTGEQESTGPVEKITLAEGQQPIAGLVYVAFTRGYFENEGLDVTLQPHTSGKACLNALLEGKADLGTVAETPLVHAALRGEETYVISTIHQADKNTVIVARKDLKITTKADLKGKKIGVSFGTNGEFFMDLILTMQGISRHEVEAINLKPEEMFNALVNGEVDAVATWNPYVINLQKELGDIGITFFSEGFYTETYNIVATHDLVNNNPKTIKKVLRALIKAEEFIKESPGESRNIIANYVGMDTHQLTELWDVYTFEVTLDQSLILTLEDEARWAIKNNLTDATEVPN